MTWRSIRVRLAVWYAAILVATFVVTGAGVWWAVRESIHESVDEDLRERLALLQKEIDVDVASVGTEGIGQRLQSRMSTPSDVRFRISNGVDWIYRSPGTERWNVIPAVVQTGRRRGAPATVFAGSRPVRVLTASINVDGATWALEIGQPLGDLYKALDRVARMMVLISPFALLVASVGGYWMSKRALEPVDRMTKTARAVSANNLGARLALRGTGDELDRLAATLNEMLIRLEAAFRRVTQFTADASHELRTPTAIIRTTAELARRRPRTEAEYIEALDRVLTESERTTRLIDDLLLLARSDAEGYRMSQEPMDLSCSLRDACTQVRVLADSAGLSFVSDVSVDCPMRGDPDGLRRLCVILLDNAIKYTPAGGAVHATLTIDADEAHIEVRDTGVGIPAKDLPHVFARFYRVGSDRSRSRGGFGLGLSIAHHIAAAHGGDISVRSAPGAGTTFRVRIPTRSAVAVDDYRAVARSITINENESGSTGGLPRPPAGAGPNFAEATNSR